MNIIYILFKDEIDDEFIRDFTNEYRRKELKRFYKSQKVQPDNWPKNLVGSEFLTKVVYSREIYVILFCTGQANVCRSPIKFFNFIANKINIANRTNITFANFDVAKNEVNFEKEKKVSAKFLKFGK